MSQATARAQSELDAAFALLAEMTSDFASAVDLETTLQNALESIVTHLDAQAGSLWLLEPGTDTLECRACAGPNSIKGMRLDSSQGIVGRSVRENSCQCIFDVSKDPAFSTKADDESGMITRSLLTAPMAIGDQKIGALQVINRRGGDGHFAEADVYPLQVLASSAALAIANSRMAASLVDAERVRREVELAAEIQRNLLPTARPDPFPVQGCNIPARTVSGDFFDILPLEDGRIAFCLGDVSGKGINAALLMAKTSSLYRCLAKNIQSPAELLRILNDEICETATRGMFVTMVAGLYDPKVGSVSIANAGHEPPVSYADDEFASFEADAPPLGIVTGCLFPEIAFQMRRGSLYVYSDGLTEAERESGEQLGSVGFRDLVTRFEQMPLRERVQTMIDSVSQLELRDDLTLLAITDRDRGGA